MLTARLAPGLYHDATVVDNNLFINFLNIGDLKHPACARLLKIETHSTLVVQNKHEQALCTYCVVCTM